MAEFKKKAVAIIPARGGSKRLPAKNLRIIAGHPLIAHTIVQAKGSKSLAEVYVSTNSEDIGQIAERYGAKVIWRPDELASDDASSEAALLHALDEIDGAHTAPVDVVVMLQCTSPVRLPGDIDAAIKKFFDDGADSLLSVCPSTHFFWRQGQAGAVPVNYDYMNRPRSQDFEPQFQENGSMYMTGAEQLRRSGSRLGGKVALFEMGFWSACEIDDEHDFRLNEWIMTQSGVLQQARRAVLSDPSLIVFDFDGVMTDNTAIVDENGKESVRVHRGDGMGLAMLRQAGINLLVLSTEQNPVVRARCEKLGISCIQGQDDKKQSLSRLLQRDGVDPEKVIYVGNDLNDLECLEYSGCAVAVADAHDRVIQAADIVLCQNGGEGAVRELAELILAARSH